MNPHAIRHYLASQQPQKEPEDLRSTNTSPQKPPTLSIENEMESQQTCISECHPDGMFPTWKTTLVPSLIWWKISFDDFGEGTSRMGKKSSLILLVKSGSAY
uniref:Uncharacterized protein n=1 Tax=Cacopsylla melanoneura TaxID=428564 RepID=A0A8D8W0S0_9HEMI